jgi:hypothetical protein
MKNFVDHLWPENINNKGKTLHFDENIKKIFDEGIINFFN